MAFHFIERHTDALRLGKGLDHHFWKISFSDNEYCSKGVNSLIECEKMHVPVCAHG